MGQLLPRGHRTFAGRLEPTRLGVVERTVARATGAPFGDYRDWAAIRAWANEIAATLAGLAPVPSAD